MNDFITGVQLCGMIRSAAATLQENKQIINELNVFPVPDGDTGTNMYLTVSTAASDLQKRCPDTVTECADIAANAMLRGARGNSGVIMSLFFRGISKSLKGKDTVAAAEFAQAMSEGVDAAYRAVMKPAEGTILTVSRSATDAAKKSAQENQDFHEMLRTALSAGKNALSRTTSQNPVLKRAGVIDAGGKGYCLVLEAFLNFLEGKISEDAFTANKGADSENSPRSAFDVFSSGEIEFAFDTVFTVIRKPGDKPLDLLRAYLDSIGDSLVISEGDDMFKVHVHTNIPGSALTEAQKYGTLDTAKIENMRFQHDELVSHDEDDDFPHEHEHGYGGHKHEHGHENHHQHQGERESERQVHGSGQGSHLSGKSSEKKLSGKELSHKEISDKDLFETGYDGNGESHADFDLEPEKRYGFVSVCAGAGMAELFRELGVDRIVTGGQTMNPSTEDILKEIQQTLVEL